jgi:hypothetical protein
MKREDLCKKVYPIIARSEVYSPLTHPSPPKTGERAGVRGLPQFPYITLQNSG